MREEPLFPVISAKAGIHSMDARFRGHDGKGDVLRKA
jgi:hypothetical protein